MFQNRYRPDYSMGAMSVNGGQFRSPRLKRSKGSRWMLAGHLSPKSEPCRTFAWTSSLRTLAGAKAWSGCPLRPEDRVTREKCDLTHNQYMCLTPKNLRRFFKDELINVLHVQDFSRQPGNETEKLYVNFANV